MGIFFFKWAWGGGVGLLGGGLFRVLVDVRNIERFFKQIFHRERQFGCILGWEFTGKYALEVQKDPPGTDFGRKNSRKTLINTPRRPLNVGLGAMRRLFEFRLATRNTESNFKKRLVPQKPFGGRFEAEILRYYGIW